MTRKLKKGGYTAVLSVVVIAAVIVFNMIVGRLPQNMRQWDLSDTGIYSLSDTTKEVLDGLTEDVVIYVVADPSTVDERITNFLARYEDLSSHIKIENVDSVLHPDKVNQLGADNNSLLISCEATGKTETVAFSSVIKYDEMSYYYYGQMNETEFDGEGQVTSGISYVTNDVAKTVYTTEGHGETALGSLVSDMLEKSSLTAQSVNLLKEGKVPEDCELLLIHAPENDLADDEKTMVMDYLNGGGQVMVVAGYSDQKRPNLQAICSEFGLNLENGLAADTKNFYQNNPYYIFPVLNTGNEVMEGIGSRDTVLVLQSVPFSQLEELPEGVTVEPFMQTSDQGLLVTEGGQTEGTYILGAVAEKELDSGAARLTVFGTPSMTDDNLNSTFTNLANLDIFMNAVTANFEDVQNVSIPAKSLEVPYNTVTNGGMWGILFILVIPIAVLIAGLLVWLRRRKL